jgi:hypothetical protein
MPSAALAELLRYANLKITDAHCYVYWNFLIGIEKGLRVLLELRKRLCIVNAIPFQIVYAAIPMKTKRSIMF